MPVDSASLGSPLIGQTKENRRERRVMTVVTTLVFQEHLICSEKENVPLVNGDPHTEYGAKSLNGWFTWVHPVLCTHFPKIQWDSVS